MIFKIVERLQLNEDGEDDLDKIVTNVGNYGDNSSDVNNLQTNQQEIEKNLENPSLQGEDEDLKSIQAKLLDPKTSEKDRHDLISKAMDIIFPSSVQNQIKPVRPQIEAEINAVGLTNNPILEYAKNFTEKINNKNFQISKLYLDFLNDMFEKNVIKPNDPKLFEKWVYNEDDENENLYKLKTITFFQDPNNIKKWGLTKTTDDGKEVPLTLNDIKNKTAQQIRVYVDEHQHGSGDSPQTIEDIFKLKNLEDPTAQYKFLLSLYDNPAEAFKEALRKLMNDRSYLRALYRLESPSWEEGKDEILKPIITDFVKKGGETKDFAKINKDSTKIWTKPGILKSLHGWMGSPEYYRVIPKSKQSQDNVDAAFEDTYTKGMTYAQAKKAVIDKLK